MNTQMLTLVLLGGALVLSASAHADRDSSGKPGIAPVNDKLYATECGACHFAYPPGLLPARSWEKLMSQLSDHFGENAELSEADVKALTAYMTANAADHTVHSKSKKIMKSIKPEETPLRITAVSYISKKHREVPLRMLQANPRVNSLSKCNACHTKAAQGSFEENEIDIPGFGRWED